MEPEGKYLFEIIVEQLLEANKKYNKVIPYYVMTSEENNNETIDFFEKMNYFGYPMESVKFFKQTEEPLVRKDGKLIIGEDKLIKLAANGNGAIYKSMYENGIIEDMKRKNVKWMLITGIDNVLVKIIDEAFLGITVEEKNAIASKSVIKKSPTESGGVFAKADGRPGIIEYIEIPEELMSATDSNGEFLLADINIVYHLFRIDALEKIYNEKLPYHVAVKKANFIDINGNLVNDSIYKFEKFIFDGFKNFEDMTLVRVEREEEFAPIKNKEGIDSPETAKKMYEDYIKKLKK